MPLENTKAEPLAPTNTKEKYVFIIRTFDKANSIEKNYILKAKSTMDMNGWVFSINSQAIICTENKRLFEIAQNIKKNERKSCETLKEKVLKIFGNFEDFISSPQVREKIIRKTREKSLIKTKFTYMFDLMELYFQMKDSFKAALTEEALMYQENLFNTLQNAYLSNKREIIESKGYKIEIFEEKTDKIPCEIAEILDLNKIFEKKIENFREKAFWDNFESILKHKLLDFLKKTKEIKKILVDLLIAPNENTKENGFLKPLIMDLRKMKPKESTYLGVSRKGGKKYSNADMSNSLSPKNSLMMFKSNGELLN